MSKSQEDLKDEKQTDERPGVVLRLDRLPGNEGKSPGQLIHDIVQRDRARAQWIAGRIQEASLAANQEKEKHAGIRDEAERPDKVEGADSAEKQPDQLAS
ncbi:hypothetical protein O6H91_13G017400 [Diphasiastrum complanatum]|uniref:Uncharacterized protein n=1 Tax=Diphasiastrum complanatum TaxID=34168 RepID=A0ACC2BSI0_DIPCM|nr:hypothetical protein O6H91_13G017400 [Diphasiastrum complanatum]